jgi:Tol biopolymer transport system component
VDGKTKIVTSSPVEEGDQDPLWSPRRDLIAFDRGYSSLYVIRPDGTHLSFLADPVSPGSFAWSPDGQSLAYAAPIPDYVHRHVYLVGSDGGEPRLLWNGLAGDYGGLAWSPDGATIAFVPGSRGIVVVDVADGRTRRVVPAGRDVRELVWSPDGKKLAYILHSPRLPTLGVVDLASRRRHALLSGSDFRGELDSLRWEASDSKLARIGAKRLVDLAPGSRTRLPTSRRINSLVAFSPDTGRVDAHFPALSPDGYVNAVVADGHGGWFIGGGFTSLGGVVCFGLAHVRVDDSVDRSWCRRLPLRTSTSPLASVNALALRGGSLIVGGSFMSIGGVPRSGLAALDVATARVLPWRPRLQQSGGAPCVASFVLRGSTAYLLGCFDRVGGEPRSLLAAVDLRTGQPTAWDPRPDENVHGDSASAIAAGETAMYVSGSFEHIGGHRRAGFAALDYSTGRALPLQSQVRSSPLLIGDSLYLRGRGEPRAWSPAAPAPRYVDVTGLVDGVVVVSQAMGERYVVRAYDLVSGRLRLRRSPIFTAAPATVAVAGGKVVAGGRFVINAR